MNLKQVFIFTLIWGSTGVGVFGCGHKDNSKQNDTVVQAYRLIDEQRSDEAIQLLEDSLAADPGNYEYKVVLASAYAHKAGIKIQKLFPVINRAQKISENLDSKLQNVEKKYGRDGKLNSDTVSLIRGLTQFSIFMEAYALIPMLDKRQAAYLLHAIYILNDLGSTLKAQDVVYRLVLEAVLFKYVVSDELSDETVYRENTERQNCHLDMAKVNKVMVKISKILIDIYNDIGFVNPNQASQMKKLAEDTANTVSELNIATTAVTGADQAASILLEQTVIQNGFGKLIKCGGEH